MKKLSKALRPQYKGLSPVPMPTHRESITAYNCGCPCICVNNDAAGAAGNSAGVSVGNQANK
ncbi:hypothetical protein F4X10_22325 [Candidatus Poribacteria bacterium]|nr:hypothetical protein [Candidatus Poribacteria bacterium]